VALLAITVETGGIADHHWASNATCSNSDGQQCHLFKQLWSAMPPV
jgi:hypothetical protein